MRLPPFSSLIRRLFSYTKSVSIHLIFLSACASPTFAEDLPVPMDNDSEYQQIRRAIPSKHMYMPSDNDNDALYYNYQPPADTTQAKPQTSQRKPATAPAHPRNQERGHTAYVPPPPPPSPPSDNDMDYKAPEYGPVDKNMDFYPLYLQN